MTTPYSDLPPRNFWKSAVQGRDAGQLEDLYSPKFEITRATAIATAGSCFAQHITRHLRKADAKVLDFEPAPQNLPDDLAQAYNYGLFSARYGNIYTVRHLLQLVDEAEGRRTPQHLLWQRPDGRLVDGLRPRIDPEAFDDPDEIAAHRAHHLKAVARMIRRTDLLIFTFGLTEAWIDVTDGTVYPTAPGVVAMPPQGANLTFHNFTYPEILSDFNKLRGVIHAINPNCRFLLTVSPVALAATATNAHVLSATTYSKSVLRAVAGDLAASHADIDYFPSYELITSPLAGKTYLDETLRDVSRAGIFAAMDMFMRAHGAAFDPATAPAPEASDADEIAREDAEADATEAACEEALLSAFAR